uniref:Putative aryl-hydrocarbon receptor-interacting protein n=1 Tax=Hyalomma excavatum TaxID=257692 RepID=A0A131XI97_9ACAR
MNPVISKFVQKKVMYPGVGEIPRFEKGAKCTFHFCVKRLSTDEDDPDGVIDDSRKLGRPMELLIGKEFKLPIWEQCIKSMKVKEVAEFTINKCLLDNYTLVSQSYRAFAGVGKPHKRRCCGMMEEKFTTGHEDLDKLTEKLVDLSCTFELLKVEEPGEYEKDAWAMTAEERLRAVPALKEQGNRAFQAGDMDAAMNKYREALEHLENLLLREKPGDEEWNDLYKMKVPILLNYSQCLLNRGEYYEVIRHTSEVLSKDPNNAKALFRRAKAYFSSWSPNECRADLIKLQEVDPSLSKVVNAELKKLEAEEKKKNKEDSTKLMSMFK